MLSSLASLDSAKMISLSETGALKSFERAASQVPAYKQLLQDKGVEISGIKNIADFKQHVPVIDKEATFRLNGAEIKKICLRGEIRDARMIISSSGHSGSFSYGIITQKEIEKSQEETDLLLDAVFGVSRKKTLLINCLAMGIKVVSSLVTVADTGVRSDIVLGLIKTFASSYDQVILVGENSFVKKILEEGPEAGVDWKSMRAHLVLGEEMLPENLRTYFSGILGVDPDAADGEVFIGSSFGVAEFGLNVFYETRELIRLRRILQRDKGLREQLLGVDLDNLPALFHYNPLKVYVEDVPKGDGLSDIVLTKLQEDVYIPLVRYNIHDEGVCLSFQRLEEALLSSGYADYLPRTKLPLVAVWGRDRILLKEGFYLRPEFVKDLLYSDVAIAAGVTGNFKLSHSKAGLRIEIQAKKSTARSEIFESRVRSILLAHLPAAIEVILYPYHEFPHSMELSYEEKFQYI